MIPEREQAIRNIIDKVISLELELPIDEVDKSKKIDELGGDSLLFITIEQRIEITLVNSGQVAEDFHLPTQSPFEKAPTVQELIDWATEEAIKSQP